MKSLGDDYDTVRLVCFVDPATASLLVSGLLSV